MLSLGRKGHAVEDELVEIMDLYRAIGRLDPADRVLILTKFMGDDDPSDGAVSSLFGLSRDQMKRRKPRVLEQLRRQLTVVA